MLQTNFARQTIEVNEVHAGPERIFDTIATSVVCDKITDRRTEVVCEKQCGMCAAQTSHFDPSDFTLVTWQFGGFVNVANPLMTTPGAIDHFIMSCALRQVLKTLQDVAAATANRHK